MKTLAALCLSLLLLSGCPKATAPVPPPITTPNPDFTITGSWQYDFTNFVPCSATVTTGCISGFTWGYINGTTLVPIATMAEPVPACSASVTANCQSVSGTQPQTFKFQGNSQLAIGSVNFYVVVNSITTTGAAQVSAADQTASPSTIAAGIPAALTVSSIQ